MSRAQFANGRVTSVNTGRSRTFADGTRVFASAIAKRSRTGRVPARGVNLDGDDQSDRDAHGGPDRAIYAYAAEDYDWWEEQLGRPLAAGLFGENLTLRGVDVSGAVIGERWRVGDAILRVTSPRIPCYKLAHVVGDAEFVKRFAAALRPGAYLAIDFEGEIAAGDGVEVVTKPERSVTLATFTNIFFNRHDRAAELLAAPGMTDDWRAWATKHAPLP